ncbi:MAG: hypothetical protein ABI760_01130 [Ferruginibacter sp.]
MNKIITLVLGTSLLLACNSRKDKANGTTPDPATENHQEHAGKAAGLVLNNGVKWKADSTTVLNVALLRTIVSAGKKESLESFVQTATLLQGGLNKMITECKMKGADHAGLHQWLEPLIEKTNKLKKSTVAENAAALLSEIEKDINLFAKYFEKS